MPLTRGEKALATKLNNEGVPFEEIKARVLGARKRIRDRDISKKKERLRGIQEQAEKVSAEALGQGGATGRTELAAREAQEAGLPIPEPQQPTILEGAAEAITPAGEVIEAGVEKITAPLTQPGDVGDASDIVLRTLRKGRDILTGVGEVVAGGALAPLAGAAGAGDAVLPTEKTKESLKESLGAVKETLAPIGELIGQTSQQVVNDIASGTGLTPEQVKAGFVAGLSDLLASGEALGVAAAAPGVVKAGKQVIKETVPALETAGVELAGFGEKIVETGKDVVKGVKKGVEAVKEAPGKAVKAVEKRLTREGREEIRKGKRLEKFGEIAQPDLTAREKSRAFKKGELVTDKKFLRGQQVKLLDGRKNRVANTLEDQFGKDFKFNNIGDAGRQINSKIGGIAKELKPSLQKKRITKKQVGNLEKFTKEIGDLHKDSPDLNVLSERRIDAQNELLEEAFRKRDVKNLDDLWQVRKDYDDAISDNVKKVDLQIDTGTPAGDKKRIWLRNRSLLNDTLEGMSVGLEKEAKKAFDIMSDLYEAQNSLATKAAKFRDKPGLVKKIVGGTLGVGGIGTGIFLNEILSD